MGLSIVGVTRPVVSKSTTVLPNVLALRGGAASGLVGSTASLTKNIMGIGVLTIAAGIAAGTGPGLAAIAMAVTTFIAACTFSLLGDVCQAGDFGTSCAFEKVWTSTLGAGSAWLPQASIGCLTFCICSVYLICLGELLPPLLTLFGVPARLRSRRASVLLAAAATFPLCLRRSLAGLEFSSYLGVAAILYTAAFSLMRWMDGTYSESGTFYDRMPVHLRARFPDSKASDGGLWKASPQTAVLFANLGVALCAHFNAPSFYRTLKDASSFRFRLLTYGSFGLVLLLSYLIVYPGYLTFGASSQPLILTNYHPTDDKPATLARIATATSLMCSFPIIFAALRESVLPALTPLLSQTRVGSVLALSNAMSSNSIRELSWWVATTMLPSLALALALALDDLGLAVGVLGSVLGGAIMYVFPPAIHLVQLTKAGGEASFGRIAAIVADAALLLYGVIGQMAYGTYITVRQARGRAK